MKIQTTILPVFLREEWPIKSNNRYHEIYSNTDGTAFVG